MPTSRRFAFPLALAAALLLPLLLSAGCGYQFAGKGSKAPFVLPDQARKVWLKSVDNPTSEAWLGANIRSKLRDEMTNRGQAQWVDKDEADAWVEVDVQDFTTDTTVTGDKDQSLKYSASISMTVSIRSAKTGEVIWNSGLVTASESFYGQESQKAQYTAVERAVERAVDRMSQKY